MERSVYRIYTLFCLALCYVVTFIKNKNKQKNEETRCFWTFYFLWMNTPYLCFMHCMAELFPLKFHVQINYVMLNINFSPKYSSHPNLCQAWIPWIRLPCPKFWVLLKIQMIPRLGWEHSSLLDTIIHIQMQEGFKGIESDCSWKVMLWLPFYNAYASSLSAHHTCPASVSSAIPRICWL